MAGRIRDEDIAVVRERSPIDEVVGEYLQLKNAGGGSLKGLCPFHDEKTPSFNVTPARGLWYCFSCADGGDVIKFVERIDSLSFREAVERLAARAGIELTYEQGGHVPGQEQSQRRRLLAAHAAAAEFYAERLRTPAAQLGREFLFERNFTLADADRFGIGFAPAEWEALTKHLRGRGFTDEEILKGGLASQGRRGPVDRFRGRLIWPIRDLAGDVIAFGARRLMEQDQGPKYLNTPETQLFRKSSVLYGADRARRDIVHQRQAVIVEGYTDVMACHLADVPTAVATCGTSFGDNHIKVLRRLLMDTKAAPCEFIFTFDGDAAGQRAVLRAFDQEQRFVTQTFVAVQGEGLDPCDLRLKHGDGAVRDLIAQRLPVFEFAIRNEIDKHNLDTTEGRLAALDAAAEIVVRIKDPALRDRYAVNLDRWLGMLDEDFVLSRVRAHGRPEQVRAGVGGRQASAGRRPQPGGNGRGGQAVPGAAVRPDNDQPRYDPGDPIVRLERQALKLAVQHPALCGPMFDSLGADDFVVPSHSAVRALIADCGGVTSAESARTWVARLTERALDDGLRDFITRLAVEPIEVPRADGEPDARFAGEVLARVEELAVTRRIVALKSRLQRMNPVDEAGYNRLFGDLIALEQRRKALVEKAAGSF